MAAKVSIVITIPSPIAMVETRDYILLDNLVFYPRASLVILSYRNEITPILHISIKNPVVPRIECVIPFSISQYRSLIFLEISQKGLFIVINYIRIEIMFFEKIYPQGSRKGEIA